MKARLPKSRIPGRVSRVRISIPPPIKINFMELFKNLFKPNVMAEREEGLEKIKRNYGPAIDARERQYDQDVAAEPKMENWRLNLNTHNEIALGYADELVKLSDLSEEDKAAVYLAVIFHDSGKLAAGLMEHHLKSKFSG